MITQENSEVTPRRVKWKPDIGYLPTPPQVVEAMLALAEVNSEDILYDLGSGDGRILITAAQRFGTQGVGIDIDPKRVRQGFENAHRARVSELVTFHQQDLFESDFSDATIVILYLLPHLNLKLRPMLLDQLPAGTRILSHDFDMGDWQPDRVVEVPSEDPAILYLWTI